MLAPQTFRIADLGIVGFLVLLEGLLSADNALILAMMVRHLEPKERHRALFYGLGGAFVFRFVAILLAKYILGLWWLQAVGAAYLLFVPGKHFLSLRKPKHERPVVQRSFWGTVVAVELADIAFAIDSVLAAVAMIRSASKIWVVFTGAAIGIILLRFAAGFFIRLLHRYPELDHVAYLLVAWVGVKLVFTSLHNAGLVYTGTALSGVQEMTDTVFWVVMAIIAVVGGSISIAHGRRAGAHEVK